MIAQSPVMALPTAPLKTITELDLTGPFHTRTPWRLVISQGPQEKDTFGEPAPGEIHICLAKPASGTCVAPVAAMPPAADPNWAAHFLQRPTFVAPKGKTAPPLLLLKTASLPGGNGSQAIFVQLLAYSRGQDRFVQAYSYLTGTNNNEEVRYVEGGPLKGDMISAEPTENAPYGFWVTVSRLAPNYTYRQVLRYRSATRYNDGNPLAVIDSEMPNIQRRLGIWRPGKPLPLPAKGCAKPRLVRDELWCGPPVSGI